MNYAKYDILRIQNLDHAHKPVTLVMSVNVSEQNSFWIMYSLFSDHTSYFLCQWYSCFLIEKRKNQLYSEIIIFDNNQSATKSEKYTIKYTLFFKRGARSLNSKVTSQLETSKKMYCIQ